MPSSKFIFPPNFDTLAKGQSFTIQIAIDHLDTGWFTNPDSTYMSSPQVLDSNGDVMGHSHVVVERLTGFGQTTPTDPKNFVYFKGLNDPAVNGVFSSVVTGGLPAGYYRIAVMHSGMNHQPSAWKRNITQSLTHRRFWICSCSSCCPTWGYGRYGLCEYMAPRAHDVSA